MFKVLKVDGPRLTTDLGCIGIMPFQYADGGKTKPVSDDDWKRMRDLFIAAPDLLLACEVAIAALTIPSLKTHDDALAMLANAVARARNQVEA